MNQGVHYSLCEPTELLPFLMSEDFNAMSSLLAEPQVHADYSILEYAECSMVLSILKSTVTPPDVTHVIRGFLLLTLNENSNSFGIIYPGVINAHTHRFLSNHQADPISCSRSNAAHFILSPKTIAAYEVPSG